MDENLREADRLCEEGVETLTPEQFHSLKECQQKLRSTYTEIIRQTDAILDRLDLATALLIEFSTKSSQLQSWIFDKSRDLNELRMRAGDLGALAETKRLLKALDKKIAGGAANLKVISQLAARINVEICNYIDELRKRELSVNSAHFAQLDRHQINETVERIQVSVFVFGFLTLIVWLSRIFSQKRTRLAIVNFLLFKFKSFSRMIYIMI